MSLHVTPNKTQRVETPRTTLNSTILRKVAAAQAKTDSAATKKSATAALKAVAAQAATEAVAKNKTVATAARKVAAAQAKGYRRAQGCCCASQG